MGIVMNIQKFCLQDGPGIRTTVFLKGCNMRCAWCHNPESMNPRPELLFYEEKCIACQKCKVVCPNGVHAFTEHDGVLHHEIHRERCEACGRCVSACLAEALEIVGREMSVDDVMQEIKKDKRYYTSSGGGVTFSGGESTYQLDFLIALLQRCKEEGIFTALETNGLMPESALQKVLPFTDLFLYDYKVTGEEAHQKWTGATGKITLENLKQIQEAGGRVWLRCPVIPGVNDTEEHFEAIRRLQKEYSCILKAEIMAYHDTGKGKWKECGKEYTLADIKTVSGEQKKQWQDAICI